MWHTVLNQHTYRHIDPPYNDDFMKTNTIYGFEHNRKLLRQANKQVQLEIEECLPQMIQ